MSDRDERKQEIVERLRAVRDPATKRDVVSAGMLKDVTHCDGAVKATIVMPATPPVLEAVRRQAEEALRDLSWVTKTNVKVEAAPPLRQAAPEGHGTQGLPGIASIVAVASGKGGVGKSTIAVNLACGLARQGARVGLLDADVYGPSIPMMLGVREAPEIVEKDGRKMLRPVEAHGVRLMSMGFLVEEEKPLIWRGPMLHGALRQFFNDVDWGPLDHLVVDLPPGTGDVALTMVQTITLSGAVIVSTPQKVAMIDAHKALAMFGQTGVHVLGIVENMSGDVFGKGGCEQWASRESVRFLGSIPLMAAVRESGDAGAPAVLSKDGDVSRPLMAMVESVAAAVRERLEQAPKRKKISIQR